MSLGEAAAEGDCCDSFEVAVESWPSGIWVTDSNTEKRRKEKPLRISSRGEFNDKPRLPRRRQTRARALARFLPKSKVFQMSSRQNLMMIPDPPTAAKDDLNFPT